MVEEGTPNLILFIEGNSQNSILYLLPVFLKTKTKSVVDLWCCVILKISLAYVPVWPTDNMTSLGLSDRDDRDTCWRVIVYLVDWLTQDARSDRPTQITINAQTKVSEAKPSLRIR